MRKFKKRATWLDEPAFSSLLYVYGVLFVRFVDLHGVGAGPVDDLGRPSANTDQLNRISGRLGQLAQQLGLIPIVQRALRHDAALEANHRKWIELAKDAEVVTPSPAPTSTPPAAPANGALH